MAAKLESCIITVGTLASKFERWMGTVGRMAAGPTSCDEPTSRLLPRARAGAGAVQPLPGDPAAGRAGDQGLPLPGLLHPIQPRKVAAGDRHYLIIRIFWGSTIY